MMNSSEQDDALLRGKASLALALKNRPTGLVVVESMTGLVFLLAALLGNSLVCFAVYKTKTLRRNLQNIFIVSLAIADVLYAVLCMLPGVGILVTGKWPFDNIMCQIQGSFALILGAVSLLTMALIAVSRYCKIARSPEFYQKIFTKRNILIMAAAPWIYAIVSVTSLFFMVHSVYESRVEKLVCYARLDHRKSVQRMIIGGYLFVITVSFPATVISYCLVYRKVRAHFAELKKSALQQNTAFENEVRITKMLFVTFVCFVICWTPALTLDQTEAVRGQYIFPRQLYLFATFCVQISSAINPLIYGFLRREFREAYKHMLGCGRR